MAASFPELARMLSEIGREAHARGWALGTSGNMSAVCGLDPLRVAITPSGVDKGRLAPEQILEIDGDARNVRSDARPSDEAQIHLAIVRARNAGAVLHTHSVWSTLLSEARAAQGGVAIEGYEMLKGLEGIRTHQHREWLPIVDNRQDWSAGAPSVVSALDAHRDAHGLLLRGHGLYTWGKDVFQARRHLEVLEFLLEVVGRAGTVAPQGAAKEA
jgi:methylthioribulose-1-phosphate dehydratase